MGANQRQSRGTFAHFLDQNAVRLFRAREGIDRRALRTRHDQRIHRTGTNGIQQFLRLSRLALQAGYLDLQFLPGMQVLRQCLYFLRIDPERQ